MKLTRKQMVKVIKKWRKRDQKQHDRTPHGREGLGYMIRREILVKQIALLGEILELIKNKKGNR